MQAKDLIVDQSSDRQIVEQVAEVVPHSRTAVFTTTLIVKAVPTFD